MFGVKDFPEQMFAFGPAARYGLQTDVRSASHSSPTPAPPPRSHALPTVALHTEEKLHIEEKRTLPMAQVLSAKRKQILDCISDSVRDRGYPPSVREIGEAVGLTSSSTVHAHLAVLQREGYLRRDPTKPRAMEVCYDPSSKVIMDARPIRHVPLVGDVAAGVGVLAQENVEELFPLPEDFTGTGSLFMLRVRGESMIDAGIMDGDFVVVRQQPDADQGDVVVAGIPDEQATVKQFARKDGQIVLTPANESMAPMVFDPDEVTVFGKVVTVMRRL